MKNSTKTSAFSQIFTKNITTLGLFDSGIGGISILNELLALPITQFVYVADTAYLPYGEKTEEFLIERAKKITQFFVEHNIFTIVIACHTSAATSLPTLKQIFPEVTFIDPLPLTTINALETTKTGSIGIMATQRSIATGMHKKLLLDQFLTVSRKNKHTSLAIIEQACPLFVPLLENNRPPEEIAHAVSLYTQELLDKYQFSRPDTVILGCTHYPFIAQEIQQKLPGIMLISGASAIKNQVKNVMPELLNTQKTLRKITFVTSGDTEKIKPLLEKYLSKNYTYKKIVTKLHARYL